MRSHTIGRALGIGLRVAGRVVGQRVAENASGAPQANFSASPGNSGGVANARVAGQTTQQASRNIRGGLAGFVRPFKRVGGIVWLEVTGVFFLLFVVAFAPTLWRTRMSYAHGPDHRTFVASAIVVAVFLYLSITSFLRARKR